MEVCCLYMLKYIGMDERRDLTKGNIYKQLLMFFFPVFLGYFFQQLYNTFDAVTVGNYVGKEALAAVGGTTSTLLNLLVNFIIGLASGVTVIVAQSYGLRDYQKVNDTVRTGIFMAVILGAGMMIFGLVFAPNLLGLMGVPKEIYDLALLYMRVYFCGLIPSMIYNVGTSVLRAVGDSKRPLYFLIIACITNIILDILFVTKFNLGVFGAALATIISQLVSAVLTLFVLYKSDDCYHYSLKEFGFDGNLFSQIVKIGIPSGINSVLYSVSNLFIQAKINSFGTNTIAAYTAVEKVDALYWNFDNAFGIATMTLVGQNFGARNHDRVKKSVKASFILEAIGTLLIMGICYFFGFQILHIFINDNEIINIGFDILRFLSLTWWLFIPIEVISSSIKACGNAIYSMIFSAIGICGVRIVYLLLFNFGSPIEALYCYPLSWFITDIIYVIYYFKSSIYKAKY